ncbi:MAG TPA: TonB-dependent receptor [Caulobacteraceae bacterium]|jgi:outer membrane receptor protein involved in Fe transport
MRVAVCTVLLSSAPCILHAQALAPSSPVSEVVVSATPVPGAGVDRDRLPVETQVLTAADLARDGEPDLLRALETQVGPVNLDSASGNPFQPTLFYHGFEASPLQGTPEDLAVYVDGVRFNTPFGDTVNWDLIPSLAIRRMTIEGSNPVFGLNALGGALNTELQTGLTFQGEESDLSGGSFALVEGDAAVGRRIGDTAVYLATSVIHEGGWRDLQSSDIQNLYGDVAWTRSGAELHLGLRFANSDLNGPGTSPVELLAADPRAQFTGPNNIKNRYAALDLRGSDQIDAWTTVQGVAYLDYFRQSVANGNAANDLPCGDGSGLLCSRSGYSATAGGAPIPAFLGENPFAYSELDEQTTDTIGYGASLQAANVHPLWGMPNHAVWGGSFDGAWTGFKAASFIGGITPVTRLFVGPGVLIDEPGNNVPVDVGVRDADYGLFASDTLQLTPALALTLSGRFNDAQADLEDRLGGDLAGDHAYSRFNPAAGLSWRVTSWLTAYAGYAEANRAPTPAELSCAGPQDSCSLANFFVGDPDLKQVVAHTVEAGLRGAFDGGGVRVEYHLGLYRSELDDDIVFVNSVTLNRAYFTNVGATRRQGVDADLQVTDGPWSAHLAYAYTDATYQSGFVEAAGSNPVADANDEVTIVPGDRLPGIPLNQVKLRLQWQATGRLSLAVTGVGQTGEYLFGDEANLTPRLPGFFIVNLDAAYRLTRRVQLFARVENVTNRTYYTYGTFSPTSQVFLVQAPGASDPRSYSPASPIGASGGVRVSF